MTDQGVGGFLPPRPATPVAGPGVAQPGDPKPVKASVTLAKTVEGTDLARKPAKAKKPRKVAKKRKVAKPAKAPPAAPVPRRSRKGTDLAKVMAILGEAKKKDLPAINAIVQVMNPLTRPARLRVMQAVGQFYL